IVTNEGPLGAATWSYKIVAKQADGSYSAASPAGTTTTGNANLQPNAVDTVTASGTPADGDTVTVNGRVYTFKTTLTGAADEIHINGQDGSLTNLAAAINGTGTIGTDYGTGTTINADVSS